MALRILFESPVDFYDSQTNTQSQRHALTFESPVDFYDSQTYPLKFPPAHRFESPVDFYDSQTDTKSIDFYMSLRAL